MSLTKAINQASVSETTSDDSTTAEYHYYINYRISDSVLTEGIDLYLNTETLLQYLRIDRRGLRRLRERGAVFTGRPSDQCVDGGDVEHKVMINNFPSPILIMGRNYWKLSEVRGWELEMVRFVQHLNDMETIARSDRILQHLDDIETLTRSVHDVVAVSAESLRSKLRSAKYDY